MALNVGMALVSIILSSELAGLDAADLLERPAAEIDASPAADDESV